MSILYPIAAVLIPAAITLKADKDRGYAEPKDTFTKQQKTDERKKP